MRGSDSDAGRFQVPDSSHSSPRTPIFLNAQAIVGSIWMPVLGSQTTTSPPRCLLASSWGDRDLGRRAPALQTSVKTGYWGVQATGKQQGLSRFVLCRNLAYAHRRLCKCQACQAPVKCFLKYL